MDGMILIIGKNNLSIKNSINIIDEKQIGTINFKQATKIVVVTALGGNIAGDIALKVNQIAKDKNIDTENILLFPSSIVYNTHKIIKDIKELISINQNIRLYMDSEMIIYEKKIKYKSFIIEKEINNINYKAFVHYWSKDYRIVLLTPEFKILDYSHIPYMAPSQFARKGETTNSFIDIKDIATNILDTYIKKQLLDMVYKL